MPLNAAAPVRVARPCRDLAAAERFWAGGLGLDVLYRHTTDGTTPGEHSLLMLGWRDASWHLELVHDPAAPVEPRPTPEDLLVIYLGEPVPDSLVARLETHGGRRVPAHNPYWDTWGVTIQDPDDYLLVLSTRTWSTA
ncbi:VOC family protein [Streptomyces millisiae]|uniref:VOC family protein n=1 Tax=Streptomyces millisiae TaxID=3075542 RepID=A0ABU2LP07_9ACTN|nr:VOC family protein [Streptomyces sp. DSM 44918]MDT0319331.1 VOC family protein [Streptomyces sp. DSM 44918]